MKNLTTIKTELQRRWYKTYLPCGLVDTKQTFPLNISLKPPTNKQILEDWQTVKHWVSSYENLTETSLQITWQNKKTTLGEQKIPRGVAFKTLVDLASFLQNTHQLKQYQTICQQILTRYPNLQDWCLKYSQKLLKFNKQWARILQVVDWLLNNLNSNLYLREIPLANIDSKFIELHKTLLFELLIILKPTLNKADNFEATLGLKKESVCLRIRFLGKQSLQGVQDIQTPLNQLFKLDLIKMGIEKIFITENKVNFLAFPKMNNSLIIFGKGYGFKDWKNWQSLNKLPLYYWGDIDADGFKILNQFKKQFPQTNAILMDQKTLLEHKVFWVKDQDKPLEKLNYLNQLEQDMYQAILTNKWQKNLRLEQERISIVWITNYLKNKALYE